MTSKYYDGQNHVFYNENGTDVYIKSKPGQTLHVQGSIDAGGDYELIYNNPLTGGLDGISDVNFNETTKVLNVSSQNPTTIKTNSQTYTSSAFISGRSPKTLKFFNGVFYIFAYNGGTGNDTLYTSVNGITWTNTTIMPSPQLWQGLCNAYDTGRTVSVCGFSFGTGSNVVAYSDSPLTSWTQTTLTASLHWTDVARSINWSTNYFVAISNSVNSTPITGAGAGSNIINYSTDGATWSSYTVTSTLEWSRIIFVPEHQRFYVISNGTTGIPTNVFMYSSNPNLITSWTNGTLPITGIWSGIAYSPLYDRLVIVSYDGKIYYSDNKGSSWTASSVPAANNFFNISWSDELQMFVVVSSNGTNRIIYSENGATFSNASTTFSKLMTLVASGNNRIILASGDNLTFNVYSSTPTVGNITTNLGTLNSSDVNVYGDNLNVQSSSTNINSIVSITSKADAGSSSNSFAALNVSGGVSVSKTLFSNVLKANTYQSANNGFLYNLYTSSTPQAIAGTTVTKAKFLTTVTDGFGSILLKNSDQDFFNVSGSSMRLLVSYCIRSTSSAASANECWLAINGASNLGYANNTAYSPAGDGSMAGTHIIQMNSGDYFSVYCYFPVGNTISSNASTYASVLTVYGLP